MNMPWPNTLGRPAALADTSSVCIGLKSPDAPAYMTRSVRVSVWVRTGASSPTFTASNVEPVAHGSPWVVAVRCSGHGLAWLSARVELT